MTIGRPVAKKSMTTANTSGFSTCHLISSSACRDESIHARDMIELLAVDCETCRDESIHARDMIELLAVNCVTCRDESIHARDMIELLAVNCETCSPKIVLCLQG